MYGSYGDELSIMVRHHGETHYYIAPISVRIPVSVRIRRALGGTIMLHLAPMSFRGCLGKNSVPRQRYLDAYIFQLGSLEQSDIRFKHIHPQSLDITYETLMKLQCGN